ncbi:hypothetical protein [Pseudoruegeria sp. HB172150]|uniref:hypothetical protein n=1 Tax=Pseudoruegeria sp. HB172150 TaxID=2721164 RepID=UPI001C12EAAB|nr:hypothetical protein [Pseudoruegeria sp. HB172150]
MTKGSLSATAALRALLSETADTHLLTDTPEFVADRLRALDIDSLCGAGRNCVDTWTCLVRSTWLTEAQWAE